MSSLFVLHPFAYLCAFLAGTRTLAPEPAEETYVELSDTEPEDTVGAATTTYPGKGENLCHYFITFCSCLAVVLERYCLIPSTYMPCLNPYSHDPHIPANHCTARLPLHSHCLVCVENLLLTLYIYGWDIMLNKKLVDIYYLLMMLNYIRRRMEGWTIPIRCFVPFESPRTRVPGIVFLDERA